MCFIALRATAFAMLLHLSQVTPGLSCTFTLFKGERMTNVNQVVTSKTSSEAGFEYCLDKCYETADCNYLVFDKAGFDCYVYVPGEAEMSRGVFVQPKFYKFDRNVSITSCPTVEEWMAQQTAVDA